MPEPRANWECAHCTLVECGPEPSHVVVYEDLPIRSTRCPVCGWKKGFRRRFDAVNVSTTGHRVAKILDPMMAPQFEQQAAMRDKAKESERQLVEDHARAIELTPEDKRPMMRQALEGGPTKWLPQNQVKAAHGMISPTARADSRNHIWPHINRRVVPVRP